VKNLPEKIHPDLRRWLTSRAASDTELIVISFTDTVPIPRSCEAPHECQDRRSANRGTLSARRAAMYRRLTEELQGEYQAKVVHTAWLINAVTVRVPLGAVPALAERHDVFYVEPAPIRPAGFRS